MTEYGRIHTDGSRSGGQPLIKTQHCPNCEAQAAEIERLRVEAQAQYDRGYYDGSTNPIVRYDALLEENERLRRDHAAAVNEANIAKARLKGVTKQWHADRAALQDQSK